MATEMDTEMVAGALATSAMAASSDNPLGPLKTAWAQLSSDVAQGAKIDHASRNKTRGPRDTDAVLRAAKVIHKHVQEFLFHKIATRPIPDTSDERILSYERFTDGLPLKQYEACIHSVPELVNLVSLADAIPNVAGVTLPFDLTTIAKRCRNASLFFAPRSFTAVQFAFSPPRSRVLLFHTGRLVGTGSNNPAASKLSILRAVRQIQIDAGVSIAVRRFSVINLVGAGTLGARLDLAAFSAAHRDAANFDRKLFVGLPWRAPNEACCAEIYSTGKMNLPGARRERDMINSYARMACEMLRMSDTPKLINLFPPELWDAHKPKEKIKTTAEKKRVVEDMWNDKQTGDECLMDDLQRARDKLTGLHSSGTAAGKKRQQIEQGGFVVLGGKRNKKPAARPGASADGANGANGGNLEEKDGVAAAAEDAGDGGGGGGGENGGDGENGGEGGLDLNSLDALEAFVGGDGEDDVFGGLF